MTLNSRFYKTKVFTGNNASKDNFIRLTGKYNIIHLATHAFINEEEPMFSGIVFYPEQREQSIINRDGINSPFPRKSNVLYLDEVYNLHLNADLLVLSTCESGTGKLIKGEGILAFTRGFIYAGAKNLIFSLWKVNDLSTKEFMQLFYTYFVETGSYNQAMRKAKLEMIKNPSFSHPYFWSSFVLIGN